MQIIVEATQLFKITVSFGNVTSLISLPCYMSHASIPVRCKDTCVPVQLVISQEQASHPLFACVIGTSFNQCGLQVHVHAKYAWILRIYLRNKLYPVLVMGHL